MRANRIKGMYVIELLENVELKTDCATCRGTLKELLRAARRHKYE